MCVPKVREILIWGLPIDLIPDEPVKVKNTSGGASAILSKFLRESVLPRQRLVEDASVGLHVR